MVSRTSGWAQPVDGSTIEQDAHVHFCISLPDEGRVLWNLRNRAVGILSRSRMHRVDNLVLQALRLFCRPFWSGLPSVFRLLRPSRAWRDV